MIEKINLTDIDNNLQQISFEVNSISSDNFEEKLKNVNMYIKQLEIKKNDLKGFSSEHEYKNICDMVHRGVKQISSKLDSIIEKKKKEQQDICSELSKVGNKEKINKLPEVDVNIKGVGNNVNRFTELYKKQEEATSRQAQKKTDKLELSDAAKKLKAEGVDSKNIEKVKLKVESGYYNSDEVINQVADEILKSFSQEN